MKMRILFPVLLLASMAMVFHAVETTEKKAQPKKKLIEPLVFLVPIYKVLNKYVTKLENYDTEVLSKSQTPCILLEEAKERLSENLLLGMKKSRDIYERLEKLKKKIFCPKR
ncbi:hypothetical protein ACFLYA_02895 [Candidatus Dependentiae bacterium]